MSPARQNGQKAPAPPTLAVRPSNSLAHMASPSNTPSNEPSSRKILFGASYHAPRQDSPIPGPLAISCLPAKAATPAWLLEISYGNWATKNVEALILPPALRPTDPTQESKDNSLASRSRQWARLESVKRQLHGRPFWALLYAFFTLWPHEEGIVVRRAQFVNEGKEYPIVWESGLCLDLPLTPGEDRVACFRSVFWQMADRTGLSTSEARAQDGVAWRWLYPCLKDLPALASEQRRLRSDGTFTLLRPSLPASDAAIGPIYARSIPGIKKEQHTLNYVRAQSSDAAFVELFTRWQNSERVAAGWMQRGDVESQRRYLKSVEESGWNWPLIGRWDNQPWGYVEVYWAKESNIATFYDVDDFDRGFHALVGEEDFRGPHRVRSWMGSLVHMMFLLDPRTKRVVLEPRASNTKMIEYACSVGGHVEKLIDLPHKRAALVIIPRERFFQLCPMQPLPEHAHWD